MDDKNFGAIEKWMLPILTEGKEILWELPTIQYYLPNETETPISKLKTTSLSPADAQIVYKNSECQDFIDVDYIKDRINKNVSTGIYDNGKLVAWGLTQDDGAMGFLHVLDEYRRKGYGYQVTLSLIEKVRKSGKLPFACIVEDNQKSINLVKKLGFKKDKNVNWFEVV